MHELILRQMAASSPPVQLARLKTDVDHTVLLAFARGAQNPQWVAKRSTLPRGMARIANEREALLQLENWADALRVPRVLGFSKTAEEVCLIQSSVAGVPRPLRIDVNKPARRDVAAAVEWLQRFQETVRLATMPTVGQAVREWLSRAEAQPEPSGVGEPIMQVLRDELRRARADDVATVATHGDYWYGNILFSGAGVGVVDCNGLNAGTVVDDLLTLFLKARVTERKRVLPLVERVQRLLFADTPAARELQKDAMRLELASGQCRLAVYFFMAKRIRWEVGYDYQPRSTRERQQAIADWTPVVHWLAEVDFPSPALCGR